ncbi:MAG: hypothetical protein ACKO86_21945 [Dolichospermum sp.]
MLVRFQWRTADAIAMSSIFRKGKYRLVWLVLAIAVGLSAIICEDSDRVSTAASSSLLLSLVVKGLWLHILLYLQPVTSQNFWCGSEDKLSKN